MHLCNRMQCVLSMGKVLSQLKTCFGSVMQLITIQNFYKNEEKEKNIIKSFVIFERSDFEAKTSKRDKMEIYWNWVSQ